MDRINGAGHVGHMFVAEDASIGRPPTEITAQWLNGVQEELCAVVAAAGMAINGNNTGQVISALKALFGNSRIGSTFLAIDWCPLPNGLIIQWGHTGLIQSNGSVTMTLPISFSVSCLCAVFCPSSQHSLQSNVKTWTLNAASLVIQNFGSQPDAGYWIAIGV